MTLIANGGTITVTAFVNNEEGILVTGETVEIRLRRISDGFFFDFSDLTFKVEGSVVTFFVTMTEKSATNAQGQYDYTFVLQDWDNETLNDSYVYSVDADAVSYHGGNGFSTSNLAAKSGFGSETVTITTELSGGTPIDSVLVRATDATFAQLFAEDITDVNGQVTFSLDPGTYTIHTARTGYTFAGQPFTLVVTGTTDQTYIGAVMSPSPPSGPDLCRVQGYVFDSGGNPLEDIKVRAEIEGDWNFITLDNSSQLLERLQSGLSDATGFWFIDLVPSPLLTSGDGGPVTYRFTFKDSKGNRSESQGGLTVPDEPTKWFKDVYIP